jgi:hypothetical protein
MQLSTILPYGSREMSCDLPRLYGDPSLPTHMNSLRELALSITAFKVWCRRKLAISLVSQELSPVSWKYGRPTSANTSEASFRRRDYLSNALWLLVLAFRPLVREVQNWPTVLRYYLTRDSAPAVVIRFRNNDVLVAPRDYIFEAIAGTLLVNSYSFRGSPSVVVDVGASIGDFALLASRDHGTRVYAFEKDSGYARYLKDNMTLNARRSVRVFAEAANRHTLKKIIESHEDRIDFLKVDCEGCEYDLLLRCPCEVIAKVKFIALEIHERPPYSKTDLTDYLKTSGFQVSEIRTFVHGHRVYAQRQS